MPKEELPPDPESLAKWRELPQNEPSRDAMPPVTGGARWALWLVGILVVVILIGLLAQGRPG